MLHLQILLEIIITEVLVHLKLIIEPLYSGLIVAPEIGSVGRRHLTGILECLGELTETGEMTVDIVGIGCHLVKLSDYIALACKIGTALLILSGNELGFCFLYYIKEYCHALLKRIERGEIILLVIAIGNECLFLRNKFILTECVESLTQASHLVAAYISARTGRNFFQSGDYLFLRHRAFNYRLRNGSGGFRFRDKFSAGISYRHGFIFTYFIDI